MLTLGLRHRTAEVFLQMGDAQPHGLGLPVAPQDIAAYAVKALLGAQPQGHAVQHLVGPRTVTMREASQILGAAIGVPNVEYVQATVDQAGPNMQAAGFSEQAIQLFVEMAQAMSDGRINATFTPTPADTTTTTLEAFVAAAAEH